MFEQLMGAALKPKKTSYYSKAKKLADQMGVTVTIERDAHGNGYWIEDDRLGDNKFCTSWHEVFEGLKYLQAA